MLLTPWMEKVNCIQLQTCIQSQVFYSLCNFDQRGAKRCKGGLCEVRQAETLASRLSVTSYSNGIAGCLQGWSYFQSRQQEKAIYFFLSFIELTEIQKWLQNTAKTDPEIERNKVNHKDGKGTWRYFSTVLQGNVNRASL